MRRSIRTWVIAAMVAAPGAALADGPGNSHHQFLNTNLNNLISPAILDNPAAMSAIRTSAGPTGRGNLGPAVEPMRPIGVGLGNIGQPGEFARPNVGRDIGRDAFRNRQHGKRDVVDRLDITDKAGNKTVEAAEKTDAKKSDTVTRVAANTADDAAPTQQPKGRPNVPPPACQ